MHIRCDFAQELSRYGCTSAHCPRLTLSTNSEPLVYTYQCMLNFYYLVPPEQGASGDYTPQIFVFHDCSVKSLRYIIANALPSLPTPHSIEFFSFEPRENPTGWSVTSLESASPVLLEEHTEQTASLCSGSSIIVTVKALNGDGCSMVHINPFPSPASPPRVLAWVPSCA